MPLPTRRNFQPALPDKQTTVFSYPYFEAIGSISYAAIRPDISFAVRSLAPFADTTISRVSNVSWDIWLDVPNEESCIPGTARALSVIQMRTGLRAVSN